MNDSLDCESHPSGEQSIVVGGEDPSGVEVDSFGGPVRVEWDHAAPMTPHGQLAFFIHYLKASGLFDAFVADCPLRYVSPNAPKKRDVLATAMLSMLVGAKRYAHIAALRGDGVTSITSLCASKQCRRLAHAYPFDADTH